MTDSNSTERRRFSRIPFDAEAHINSKRGELHLNCKVIDISLNGVLVVKPETWLGKLNSEYQLDLILKHAQLVIKMDVSVAHLDENSIGFICEHIDLDSITHLKRLVELNLGDEELLHRELSSLIH